MQIIKPSVEIIREGNPFKKIEMAGRTCYKSESAITDDSAEAFFHRLVKSQHTAMLEHATFVFEVDINTLGEARQCRYLNCTYNVAGDSGYSLGGRCLVSGNLRAINESGLTVLMEGLAEEDPDLAYGAFAISAKPERYAHVIDFESLMDKSNEEIAFHRYTTMRFVTDRGVTHEMVRHRPFSFAQESSRYCCYSKEKFGGGDIRFIEPAGYENWSMDMKQSFEGGLREAEQYYNRMVASGAQAQQARAVLPNAVKTEIVVTGNDAEWQHFFNLRSKGTTGAPHPDMKRVADDALKLYEQAYVD